jgi:membrane associated rhomboid family serine protease
MIQQILRIKFVRWKKSVASAVSMVEIRINGFGLLACISRITAAKYHCRFITPIFLHAGFVHILLNMLVQMTLSAQIEREMGSGGFFLTYFAAGIFGLASNFSFIGDH